MQRSNRRVRFGRWFLFIWALAVLALTALAALWRLRRYNFMFLGGR